MGIVVLLRRRRHNRSMRFITYFTFSGGCSKTASMKRSHKGNSVQSKIGRPTMSIDKSFSTPLDLNGDAIPESKVQDEPKSPCKACGTPMPLGASLCPTCKTYQHPLKRGLQFYGGMATLIVLSGSLLTWLYTTVPNLIPRRHLSVVASNSNDTIIVFNDGTRDIFVSHAFMQMRTPNSNWKAYMPPIRTVVPPGQYHEHKLKPPPDMPHAGFVRGMPEPQWLQLLSRAVDNSQCFTLFFLAQDDAYYKMIAYMAGPSLNTFPVYAYVEYLLPGSSTPYKVEFPAIGIVRQDLSSPCQ
jgi:hypothetical protein